jgi:hypothetical protein
MNSKKILDIVKREMSAFGEAWRVDYSGFRGEMINQQIESLNNFIENAEQSDEELNFTEGTDFKNRNYKNMGIFNICKH